MSIGIATSQSTERHFSIDDIADMWHLHRNTVNRLFKGEPGVVVLYTGEKKKNRQVRIPQHVLDRVHLRSSTGK